MAGFVDVTNENSDLVQCIPSQYIVSFCPWGGEKKNGFWSLGQLEGK